MNSFHHRLHAFAMTGSRKLLFTSHHLTHNLASNTTPFDFQSPIIPPQPQSSIQDPAKTLVNQLSNCTNIQELNQFYAHITRTQFLHFHTAAFHWNNIIRSYIRLDAPHKALHVYVSMSRSGVLPDCYTFPIVLKAACQLFAVTIGRQIHSVAIRVGLQSNEYCESGFIALYSKSGEFRNAYKMFDENPERKLGSWNAIIAGLCQGGCAKDVIGMFIEMRKFGFEPDDVTMVSVTSACGSLGDLNLALQLHKYVFHAKRFEKPDILMLNSLIDMYGKCGKMDLAHRVFSGMEIQNVSSWTSMIVGYATHGLVNEAIDCFHRMREAGVRPNHVTFVGMLSACIHGGRVREGRNYFDMMRHVYGILPQVQHYGCMVDLLGRAGLLDEARQLVEGMPMKPNTIIWGCLMNACEKYENVEIGEWVAKHLVELEPWNDGVYVVLSNIYASRGLWEEVEKFRGVMKQQRVAKIPAYSLTRSSN